MQNINIKYKYLLFDNDGTIMDFDKSEKFAFEQTFNKMKFEIEYSEVLLKSYSACNLKWWKKLERGECTKAELTTGRFKSFLEENNLNADPEGMCNYFVELLSQNNHLIDGALDLLKELSVNHKIYIITNGISKVQHRRIENSPIWQYVDELYISEDTGFEKPHHKFFEYVFEKGNIQDKSECLVIGDSLTSDIQGANNFGLDCIWYNPKNQKNTTCQINYTAKSIDDILGFIK